MQSPSIPSHRERCDSRRHQKFDDNSQVLGYHVCGLKTLQDMLHHLIRRGQIENYQDF